MLDPAAVAEFCPHPAVAAEAAGKCEGWTGGILLLACCFMPGVATAHFSFGFIFKSKIAKSLCKGQIIHLVITQRGGRGV